MNYLIPNEVYDILKWVGLIFLPAAAVLVATIGPAWGWPQVDNIVLTLNAVGVFIGTLIGASHLAAVNNENKEG